MLDQDALPLSEWTVQSGDRFIADVSTNMGMLIRKDGSAYTKFLIATGQRRVVRYIGRVYNAATPIKTWTARTREVKGDRITFGPEGIFLRLFDEDQRTPYGIHSHRSIAEMLADDERYKSMGCILVSNEILSIIEHTMEANEGELVVETVEGFSHDMLAKN